MAKQQKHLFYCTECGNETLKWQGQCPACGSWNTIVEAPVAPKKNGAGSPVYGRTHAHALSIEELDSGQEDRFQTGIGELDRVLGGGAVEGSLVLVGGAPGIGKSTLLLQLCGNIADTRKVLYVSGEESGRQIKMRAERLGLSGTSLFLLIETSLHEILQEVDTLKPDVLIIDSIQTLYNEELDSAPGSIGQVKDCTMALMRLAKDQGITTFIVGHINKEGSIAGPKVLEHMVDCVLYFEGEQSAGYRILRAAKNRFGSTNEIGVFRMAEDGLDEVPNPSEMLLSGRPKNTPGTCVTCVMEGTRPVLAEVQALITPTSFNVPRRTSNGVDYNRAMLLLAVLEKRGRLKLSACDAYINVIGGLSLDEPAADLATVLAIASSHLDRPISDTLAAVGEIGLTGEIRSVFNMEQRLSEVERLGFTHCIAPVSGKGGYRTADQKRRLHVIEVQTIQDALQAALGAKHA